MQPVVTQQQDLVLVGGGHSHVLAIRMLAMQSLPGVRITLVSPASHTPYSGMLPGLIAGHYAFEETHIDLSRLCQWAGVRFIESAVTALDPGRRVLSIEGRPELAYDLLSLDIGALPERDSVPGASEHAVPVKPVARFWQEWQHAPVDKGDRVAVVGGGAGSVELILAMAHRLPDRQLAFDLYCGAQDVLPGYNSAVRRRVKRALADQQVAVHCDAQVVAVEQGRLSVSREGTPAVFDRLFWCTGAVAAPWIADSGLATDDSGFLKINDSLQSVDDEAVFAAGDVAIQVDHPRPRAGVFAVRQAPVLAHNLRQQLFSKPLQQHRPQQRFLSLLALGGRRAVADRGVFCASGDWVWRWKDRIDRKFMQRFVDLPPMRVHDISPSPVDSQAPCGGCGAKVGGDTLRQVLGELAERYPEHCTSRLGSDDAVLVSDGEPVMQSVDVLRAMVSDPWLMGRIAANHALSDLYAVAARPRSAQAIVSLPFATETLLRRELQQLLAGALYEFSAVGCQLAGGHSMQGPELSVGFIVNGVSADGEAQGLPKQGLNVGDELLLCKPLGTGALFAAHMELLADGRHVRAAIDQMLVSNREAARLAGQYGASAATDITGFGLAGHLREMLTSAQGATLRVSQIPLLAGAKQAVENGIFSTMQDANRQAAGPTRIDSSSDPLAAELIFDPQTSGGLLIGIATEHSAGLCEALRSAGYTSATVIGSIISSSEGDIIVS